MGLSREEAVRRLVVALDVSDDDAALALARSLRGAVGLAKIGLEAFTASGPDLVRRVRDAGLDVFLDLKLHDIPNTVERAAANCSRLGVAILNVHAAGGAAMLRAAVAGAQGAGAPVKVLAVTVLTSLDEAGLAELDMPGSAADRVTRWAAMAEEAGCDGVVCSPREVERLRAERGPGFVLLTPGIRPAGSATGDQRRVATPADAVRAGTDYLVVGRPITAASDPRGAAEAILAEMCGA